MGRKPRGSLISIDATISIDISDDGETIMLISKNEEVICLTRQQARMLGFVLRGIEIGQEMQDHVEKKNSPIPGRIDRDY